MRRAWRVAVLVSLVSLGGCAMGQSEQAVQRTTEGPTAEEVFRNRFLNGYGRLPTFDESLAFRADLDQRVSDYMAKHPEVSTSTRASQFTFQPRISVGMTKEEVVLLGGTPYAATPDEAEMQAAARQFWPTVKEHATEMWVYPGGWQLYFGGDRLVDLTVVGKPPL
jgi:hypothetical protein